MRIAAKVLEQHYCFDNDEWLAWKSGDKRNFPKDPRLVFTANLGQRSYYFGETWVCRMLMKKGWICWQDRYDLYKTPKDRSSFYLYSLEISALLGKKTTKDLQNIAPRIRGFKLKQPDVVAFNPYTQKWFFGEVKLPHDSLKAGQLKSLAVLNYVTGADVAVVQLSARKALPPNKTSFVEFECE